MKKFKTSKEIAIERANLLAEAEKYQVRLRAEGEEGEAAPLSDEEVKAFKDIVAIIESLDKELEQAEVEERLAAQKAKTNQPIKAAPVARTSQNYHVSHKESIEPLAEAFKYWAQSQYPQFQADHHKAQRCAEYGFNLGSKGITLNVNYSGLERSKRAGPMTTVNTGFGAEWVNQSVSNMVTDYLALASPVLQYCTVDSTAGGEPRKYMIRDMTALESTLITASGGSEASPTIPTDIAIVSDSIELTPAHYTSGVVQISWEETQDSAVDVMQSVLQGIQFSHATRLEHSIVDGDTSFDGIADLADVVTPVSASFDLETIDELYGSIATPYRTTGCVWLCDSTVKESIRRNLRDTTNRSLFERHMDVASGVSYDFLYGFPILESRFAPADTLFFFNAKFIVVRMVSGENLQTFFEKYWPHVGIAGNKRWAIGTTGPNDGADVIKSITVEGS